MKKNKLKSWKIDTKYTSVRRRVKRRTNKIERRNYKKFIKEELESL